MLIAHPRRTTHFIKIVLKLNLADMRPTGVWCWRTWRVPRDHSCWRGSGRPVRKTEVTLEVFCEHRDVDVGGGEAEAAKLYVARDLANLWCHPLGWCFTCPAQRDRETQCREPGTLNPSGSGSMLCWGWQLGVGRNNNNREGTWGRGRCAGTVQ